jgi:hypothetical protein
MTECGVQGDRCEHCKKNCLGKNRDRAFDKKMHHESKALSESESIVGVGKMDSPMM